MNADEKKCPDCAEVIKLDALKCKHCGKTFSEISIKAEKSRRKLDAYRYDATDDERKIDEILADVRETYVARIYSTSARFFTEQQIAQAASRGQFNREQIRARLLRLDYRITGNPDEVSDEEVERLRGGWETQKEARRNKPVDVYDYLDFLARQPLGKSYSTDMAKAISNKIGITERAFRQAAKERGFEFSPMLDLDDVKTQREWRKEVEKRFGRFSPTVTTSAPSKSIKAGPTPDDQYGVLQPAANLAAGCLSLWQWVFLIFLVALIIVAVKSIFE